MPPRPPVRPAEPVKPVEWAKYAAAVEALVNEAGIGASVADVPAGRALPVTGRSSVPLLDDWDF